MYLIHRSIDIDFSHHVRGHVGGCINVHGHTWKFEVCVAAKQLDDQGFVIDFGELERRVLLPCHDLLDHGFAIGEDTYQESQTALAALGQALLSSRDQETRPSKPVRLAGAENRFPGGMKVAVFPFAPTSERLAGWLYKLADSELSSDRVSIAYVRIYETLHPVESVAEYRPN